MKRWVLSACVAAIAVGVSGAGNTPLRAALVAASVLAIGAVIEWIDERRALRRRPTLRMFDPDRAA